MAKTDAKKQPVLNRRPKNKRTSIGSSQNTRPKHKQAVKKVYRGQGR